jgi:hypothetical protein
MAIEIPGASRKSGLRLPQATAASRTEYDPLKQAEGYTRRLEAVGVDVKKETDDRNIIGRALNLQKNQNFLFDVFEVIGRPQQAIFGALEAAGRGEDVFKGFTKGLSGDDFTRFKDVLTAYGAEDDPSKKFELVDILGFAGDIFLDPVDLAVFATTAGIGNIALTAKDVGQITRKASWVKRVADASGGVVKNANDITRVFDEASKARKVLNTWKRGGKVTNEALSSALKAVSDSKELSKVINTALEGEKLVRKTSALGLAGRGIKSGFGATIQFTDSQVGKLLRSIDEKNGIIFNAENIKNIKDFAGMTTPSKKVPTLLKDYYSIKNTVLATLDIAKLIPEKVLDTIRKTTGRFDFTQQALLTKSEDIMKQIDNAWADFSKMTDDAGELLFKSKDEVKAFVQRSIEYKFRFGPDVVPDLTLDEILKTKGHRLSEETFQQISRIAQEIGVGELTGTQIGKLVIRDIAADGTATYRLSDEIVELLDGAIRGRSDELLYLNQSFKRSVFYDQPMMDFLNRMISNPQFDGLINEVNEQLKGLQQAVKQFQEQAKLANFTEEGYIRHVYNPEFEQLRKIPELRSDNFISRLLPEEEIINIGNVQAVAERQFKMSAYEANRVMDDWIRQTLQRTDLSDQSRQLLQDLQGKGIFIESIQASIDDWIKEIPRLVKQATQIDEILVKMIVKTDDAGTLIIDETSDLIVLNYKGGKNIPPGYVSYKHDRLIKQLEKLTQVIDSPEMVKVLEYLKGLSVKGEAVIDKNIFGMIKFMSDPKDIPTLIKYIEGANNFFKRTKLLSPGFQLRNIFGNSSNMFLVGMPLTAIPGYFKRSDKILREAPAIAQKVLSGQTLDAAEELIFSYFKRFADSGFINISDEIYDTGEKLLSLGAKEGDRSARAAAEYILRLNNTANEFMDSRFRMSLLLYADQNPNILANLGVNSSEDVVRRALFDPKATSALERQYIKKIVPFYTFAKKNLAFQTKNIVNNPVRYNRLQKAIGGLWNLEGVDWDEIEEYKQENFWIPVPGLTKDGKYTAIKLNLPVGDLGEFLDSPLRKTVSLLGPMVRVPFELATGTQIFTQRPIQDFEGQRGYNFPFMTRKQEYLLSQTGLDVPLGTVQGGIQSLANVAGLREGETNLGTLLPSAFTQGSITRAQQSEQYDYLNNVRNLYSYYKQEMGTIPTIAELENEKPQFEVLSNRMRGLKIPK